MPHHRCAGLQKEEALQAVVANEKSDTMIRMTIDFAQFRRIVH
jgi:hypothetical protein